MINSACPTIPAAVEWGDVIFLRRVKVMLTVCSIGSEVKKPFMSLSSRTEQTPTALARAVASPRSIASSIVDLTRSRRTS
jgi:hypothetical protein